MNSLSGQELWILLFAAESVVLVLFFIYLLVLGNRFKKVRRQFNRLMNGVEKDNLEELLNHWLERLQMTQTKCQSIDEQFQYFEEKIKRKKGNAGVVRFNAFEQNGSDLSFSVAVTDDAKNGFVLTSIYGREESRIYAKPLENGSSVYNLTEEELEAIALANQNQK